MLLTIDAQVLKSRLGDENLVIIDCRFSLGDKEAGRFLYEDSHLPGAYYLDLEADLSGRLDKHGGRHPLPNTEVFRSKLSSLGIDKNSRIVLYDDGTNLIASRLWWMLKYYGLENVLILKGGFQKWQELGLPITKELPKFTKSDLEFNLNEGLLASYEEVLQVVNGNKQGTILVDCREEKRFRGQEELIDKKSGRIPCSVNYFWQDVIENNTFKEKSELERIFSELDQTKEIILYCGSGVSAAPTYIALKLLNFKNVKIYVGSFSDWISYDKNPISKG